MRLFSPAQVVGYIAFVLSVLAFLQKTDRRLKIFIATQSFVYAVHFVLLGNLPASSSSIISSARTFLALRYRSLLLAAAIVVLNLGVGAVFVHRPAGWLPVMATCFATLAMFTLGGVWLRSVLLVSTSLWLVNDVLSGSIGGTLLESVNAVMNVYTMVRMVRMDRSAGSPFAIPERG